MTFSDAKAVTRLYRRLVFLFLIQYPLVPFLAFGIAEGVEPSSDAQVRDFMEVLTFSVFIALIAIFVWFLVTSYKLMARVGSRVPSLWVLAMSVPLLNILVLAGISARATAWCKSHGIKVGFLGPSKRSLEQLRNAELDSFSDGPESVQPGTSVTCEIPRLG